MARLGVGSVGFLVACAGAQPNVKARSADPASPAPSVATTATADQLARGDVDAGPGDQRVRVEAAPPPATRIAGRLPPETVQAIVRAHFGAFRRCYEEGLRNSPSLQAHVTVKFVIDREGRVAAAADEGSDSVDATVVACVLDSVRTLRFPKPEGGVVTVVYPIIWSPGD